MVPEAEIGGYFELERSSGSRFHDDALALNSARNALAYVIEARNIQKIWLPDYICDSVSDICDRTGTEIGYYEIDRTLRPRSLPEVAGDELLYVVNYFGLLSVHELDAFAAHAEHVAVDSTQAFFAKPTSGADTIYTCRKFFGVADGAYVYTDAKIKRPLPKGTSAEWMQHLLGRFESTANEHYSAYRANETRLASEPIAGMSALTENVLRGIDYEAVAARRHQNFQTLDDRLGARNCIEPAADSAPFAYPLLLEGGGEIRSRLHARKAYVPTLWPNVMLTWPDDTLAHRLARDLLPLPVDHRYDEQDMHDLADRVEEALG